MLLSLKLSLQLVSYKKLYNILEYLADFSFWIYASHGVVLSVIIKLYAKYMPLYGGYILLQYFGSAIISIALILVSGIFFRKFINPLFDILTGGRG